MPRRGPPPNDGAAGSVPKYPEFSSPETGATREKITPLTSQDIAHAWLEASLIQTFPTHRYLSTPPTHCNPPTLNNIADANRWHSRRAQIHFRRKAADPTHPDGAVYTEPTHHANPQQTNQHTTRWPRRAAVLERTARRLLGKPERPTLQRTRRPPRSLRKLQQKTLNGQRAQRRPTPKSELSKHADLPSDHLERCSARSTHPRLLLRVYSARPTTGWTLSQETCHIRPHPRARLTLHPHHIPLDHEGTIHVFE